MTLELNSVWIKVLKLQFYEDQYKKKSSISLDPDVIMKDLAQKESVSTSV